MNKDNPIILYYGLPNTCKPLHYIHLRSFVMGDFFRRVLIAGKYSVISDLHINDLGTPLGFLMDHIKNYKKKEKSFSSMDSIYKAFFSMKKMAQNDPKIKEIAINELVLCQNDPDYMKPERNNIYETFLTHTKKFMQDLNISADFLGKESDYLDHLKMLSEYLIASGQADNVEGSIIMRASPSFTQDPLMIRHQDGRYLYSAVDLSAIIQCNDQLKARKILYIMSGKQTTQMNQVFDAASQLNIKTSLVYVKLSDFSLEGESTPRNPAGFLKELALLPCEDIIFPDADHKKCFLYAAFKLQNIWQGPKDKIILNLDCFQKEESYVFLKNFGFYREKYSYLIHEAFESLDIHAMAQEVEETNSLVPVTQILKKYMSYMTRGYDVSNSINVLAKVLSLLGLDNWKIGSVNFNHS